MKIISYKFTDTERDSWEFSELKLKQVNLFVGMSGCGKTRTLNTIFNIGRFIAMNDHCLSGNWEMKLQCGDDLYEWQFRGVKDPSNESDNLIDIENLTLVKTTGERVELVVRTRDSFKFKGKDTVKL